MLTAANSASRLQVNDLVPNSQGITVALSPKKASLFDIEYMLVNGSDVVYTTKTEKLSLTSAPDIFSAPWGTLLENNKEYTGRVKIQVYSPDRGVISSTERFTARDDAEITDIYKDETGASATVYGRSQVPFEGSLVFSVYKLNANSEGNDSLVESVRERVPVLLNNDDETVEVAWKERLPEGIYRLEIELIGNDGDVIERRETIIESDLSRIPMRVRQSLYRKRNFRENDGNGIPGFSVAALISGLAVVFVPFQKLLKTFEKHRCNNQKKIRIKLKKAVNPMRYELFIALRQIRARKFQTLLSVGAIALAVMVLTVSQALMVGFTDELYNTTVNKLPHVSVSPQEGEDYIYLYRTLMKRIN